MTNGTNRTSEIMEAAKQEPIAVIGMACRFPGANSIAEFWDLLREGREAVRQIPADRWDWRDYYDPDHEAPDKMITRRGGFIEDIDKFDPQFFGISPREARAMDPQQKMILEVAWQALEDAGQVLNLLAGSATGVFIGVSTNDYSSLPSVHGSEADPLLLTGNSRSIVANRLSYVYDLRGPCVSIDTACSSSLVAIHLACRSLHDGESTLAIAGGVNSLLNPMLVVAFSKGSFLSPDGRCKAFDADANGFVRAEGAGAVILKTLSKAIEDKDPIHGLIIGSAVNQDGRSSGITAPNPESQKAVLRAAYRCAGISPGSVQYVEAHGTGTALGDPIEVNALGSVLAEGRDATPCAIGSVKTNIGHLEPAAGIAGLIKTILAMKHRLIPPSLHFRNPNPRIPFDELALKVQKRIGPWPNPDLPLIAGVSGYGFGGTNSHVVLREVCAQTLETRNEGSEIGEIENAERSAQLFTLSAATDEGLETRIVACREQLMNDGAGTALSDFCFTAAVRQTHHDYRLAAVARSKEELLESLEQQAQSGAHPSISRGRRHGSDARDLAFVYSGQGPQWWAMGRELLNDEEVFRSVIDRCDEALGRYADWSLLTELTAKESESRLDETEFAQPALFALQLALTELWKSWGIEPGAVVGHSVGEVAAAHVSGTLGFEDAIKVIFHRGRLMQGATGLGKMAVVGLSAADAEILVTESGGLLSIAATNNPAATVLSGDEKALENVVKELETEGVFVRSLPVNYAFHSHFMEPFQAELTGALKGIIVRRPTLPIISTVTGVEADEESFTPLYWGRQIRETVRFDRAMESLLDSGYETFVEIAPHPTLSGDIVRNGKARKKKVLSLPSLRRGEDERGAMLGALGALYTRGHIEDFRPMFPDGGRCVPFPPTPMQREHSWIDDAEVKFDSSVRRMRAKRGSDPDHPLLDRFVRSADEPARYYWESDIDARRLRFLADHKVQDRIIIPASFYIEMALAGAREIFGSGPYVLENVHFKRALALSDGETKTLQLAIKGHSTDALRFEIYSQMTKDPDSGTSWALHASGALRAGAAIDLAGKSSFSSSPADVRQSCTQKCSGEELYAGLSRAGFNYGPSFRGLQRLWRRAQPFEAVGLVEIPQAIAHEAPKYLVHPAVLDATGQIVHLLHLLGEHEEDTTYVPVEVGRVVLHRPCPSGKLWVVARRCEDQRETDEVFASDVTIVDEEDVPIVELLGVHRKSITQSDAAGGYLDLNECVYELNWREQSSIESETVGDGSARPGGATRQWAVFGDDQGFGGRLFQSLTECGESCHLVSSGESFERLRDRRASLDPGDSGQWTASIDSFGGSGGDSDLNIVYCGDFGAKQGAQADCNGLESTRAEACYHLVSLVQALSKLRSEAGRKLWIVTNSAQSVGPGDGPLNLSQAPLWGLSRVIAMEHPDLNCKRIDLGSAEGADERDLLLRELLSGDQEDQIAFRGLNRYVARLALAPLANESNERSDSAGDSKLVPAEDRPFRVEILKPRRLESLAVLEARRRPPGPGEIEIEVRYAGLNFNDVMKAMGIYPSSGEDTAAPLGGECAGCVVSIGEGVDGFEIGDEVIAVGPHCFASHVTTPAAYVVTKPKVLTFEQGAAIPIAFSTAHYGLNHLARLQPGERVLIHAASGGVGLAAIQIAKKVGAEIFATAGSPEKRDYLHSLGIEHVMNSRTLEFAPRIMEATGGEGVDVILNSLTGEAIQRGLDILRPQGRFLEIGKKDIYQNSSLELAPFRKNLSYFAIDLDAMARESPVKFSALLGEVVQEFESGALAPPPIQSFTFSAAADALRLMAQAKHRGKIVLKSEGSETPIEPTARNAPEFRGDATYLITGGLGDLGLAVAGWMCENGARNVALMGRSEPRAEALVSIEKMESFGVSVKIVRADVANADELGAALDEIEAEMPPLRGVIHAAGVLDDAIILNQSAEKFERVMAPKVSGALNLHHRTKDTKLDFFVLFSSVASIIGSPGQGNYAAANAFMDALAHERRRQGLRALSINWGPWAEIGMAARARRTGKWRAETGPMIPPRDGLRILGRLIHDGAVQRTVLPVDLDRLYQMRPDIFALPLLADLAEDLRTGETQRENGKNGAESPIRAELLSLPSSELRREFLQELVRAQLGLVLGLSAPRIDVDKPFESMGLDSLMAIELMSEIEDRLSITLTPAAVWNYPAVAPLVEHLAKILGVEIDSTVPETEVEAADAMGAVAEAGSIDDVLDEIERLPKEEIRRRLANKGS